MRATASLLPRRRGDRRGQRPTGGTWAGAVENLKAQWVPLYVRAADDSDGARGLIAQGGVPLSREDIEASDFLTTLGEHEATVTAPTLFDA